LLKLADGVFPAAIVSVLESRTLLPDIEQQLSLDVFMVPHTILIFRGVEWRPRFRFVVRRSPREASAVVLTGKPW
jgi:hypothetical protein